MICEGVFNETTLALLIFADYAFLLLLDLTIVYPHYRMDSPEPRAFRIFAPIGLLIALSFFLMLVLLAIGTFLAFRSTISPARQHLRVVISALITLTRTVLSVPVLFIFTNLMHNSGQSSSPAAVLTLATINYAVYIAGTVISLKLFVVMLPLAGDGCITERSSHISLLAFGNKVLLAQLAHLILGQSGVATALELFFVGALNLYLAYDRCIHTPMLNSKVQQMVQVMEELHASAILSGVLFSLIDAGSF